jgi:uncharacterized protein (TIGR03437 family)
VVGGLNSAIDRVDFDNRVGAELPSLGSLENKINSYTVLAATPNGASIFGVVADGSVFLYDSNSDTFPVFRKDFQALSGAYAASNLNQFVVFNNVMNASLVTAKKLDTAGGIPSGFAFTSPFGFLATTGGASSPGVLQRLDMSQGVGMPPTRTVESTIVPFPIVVPPTPVPGAPPPPPAPDPNISPFTRTVAPLSNGNAIVLLTQSGFTVLAPNFDAATAPPQITAVVNTADRSQPLTAGGLITVLGSNLSQATVSANAGGTLPTVLGGSCVTVNGSVIPLFLVSPPQINAQLPLTVGPTGVLIVYAPGGVSNPFNLNIQPTAPSVLQVPSGPGSTILVPAVFREASSLPVNLVDPIHKGDHLIIYASGLGPTDPPVDAGSVSPNPPAIVLFKPVVTLGGVTCPVTFAGLTPGQIGVYQIDVNVPQGVTQGLSVPLTVSQGTSTSTVYVRVVQ